MKIIFIGTGSAKASLKRFHSSILVVCDNYNLLIDAGDGISKALLAQRIDFNKINGILFSHFHPDHYAGFASLIVQMKMNKRSDPLEIYVHNKSQYILDDFLYNSFLFYDKLGFEIINKKFEHNSDNYFTSNSSFISRANTHLDDYKKYDTKDLLNFSSSSFLIKHKKSHIFYSGDIGSKNDLKLFDDFNIDCFISEVTHVKIEEIFSAVFSKECKKIILTHISDEDEKIIAGFSQSLSNEQRMKILAAEDGLTVNI